jgi:hypothetical protein
MKKNLLLNNNRMKKMKMTMKMNSIRVKIRTIIGNKWLNKLMMKKEKKYLQSFMKSKKESVQLQAIVGKSKGKNKFKMKLNRERLKSELEMNSQTH